MGGIGSGTWERLQTKRRTEDCHALDVHQLAREGLLQVRAMGTLTWTTPYTGHAGCYTPRQGSDRPRVLYVVFRWTGPACGDGALYDIPVTLQTTTPHFGGRRWWFTCPAPDCNRRVGKLYFVGPDLACRYCHDLTYTSCQGAHLLERLLLRDGTITPEQTWLRPTSTLLRRDQPRNMHLPTVRRLAFGARDAV